MKDFQVGDRVLADNKYFGVIIRISKKRKDITVKFDNGDQVVFNNLGLEKSGNSKYTIIKLSE